MINEIKAYSASCDTCQEIYVDERNWTMYSEQSFLEDHLSDADWEVNEDLTVTCASCKNKRDE